MAGLVGLPGWLRGLVEETFFVDCETHKSMKNMFCLHCCISICHKCEPNHSSHRLIQVRARRGGAVVKLDDIKDLINCSQIRTYSANAGEVIYLRPQPRDSVPKFTRNVCSSCGNNLNYEYRHCSLTCKVEHAQLQGNGISSLLLRFDASQIALTESENLQTNVSNKPDDEEAPDLAPIDFVQEEGSSSGWSIGEIVESSKKKK